MTTWESRRITHSNDLARYEKNESFQNLHGSMHGFRPEHWRNLLLVFFFFDPLVTGYKSLKSIVFTLGGQCVKHIRRSDWRYKFLVI